MYDKYPVKKVKNFSPGFRPAFVLLEAAVSGVGGGGGVHPHGPPSGHFFLRDDKLLRC
ncbi:MAG: hypothetical protein H0Z39_07150 [Peptococcaceae bacterium]|nr:hypothetical protein [Peptococcaceae bacterium]